MNSEHHDQEEGLEQPLLLEDVCVYCRLDNHNECDDFWIAASIAALNDEAVDWTKCCCGGTFDLRKAMGPSSMGASGYLAAPPVAGEDAYFDGFGGTKNLADYADPLSSGRKQAAQIAPITPGLVCEWAWLAEAGGGVLPIIGCPGRPASDRHHGPDKNTLHNALGVNLHRICDWCHAQWHAKNDPFYGPRALREDGTVDPTVPFTPMDGFDCQAHNPTKRATDKEVYAEDALRREEARKHGAKI